LGQRDPECTPLDEAHCPKTCGTIPKAAVFYYKGVTTQTTGVGSIYVSKKALMRCQAEREAKQLKYFKSLTKNLSMRTPTKTEKMNLNQKLKLRTLNEAQRTTLEERLNTRTLTDAQRTENIDKLFELNLETDLLVEMKELQDELNAVSSIFEQQRDVLRRLQELCSHDRNTEDETSSEPLKRPWMPNAERSPDALEQSEKDEPKGTSGIVHQAEEESKDSEKDMPILSNRSLVDDNLAIVMSNIQIIEDLQPYAEEVHTSVLEFSFKLKVLLLTNLRRLRAFSISSSVRLMRGKHDSLGRARSKATGKEM
jgi:hypothetical protein